MVKDEMKNRISFALRDPILQQGFETICKELEQEKKLNAEIKARFVKCNTCTPDMKDKCLMFNENLCEGERCEELVDLMSLVDKRDSDDKLTKAKEIIEDMYDKIPSSHSEYYKDVMERARQFLKEIGK